MKYTPSLKRLLLALIVLFAFACDDDVALGDPPADAGPDGATEVDRGPTADRGPPVDLAGLPEDRGPAEDARPADARPEDAASEDAAAVADRGPASDLAPPEDAAPPDQGPPPPAAPIYEPGPYAVRRQRADPGPGGPPRLAEIYIPAGAPVAPVVVFQHGFLMDVRWYSGLLSHVASHGFVVVAAQMYAADGLPLGKPTAAEEAATAAELLTWIANDLDDVVDVPLDGLPPGLAGHSRGGKVAWLLLAADRGRARAVAGVDPVDGQGGPFGGEARVLDQLLDFGGMPKLVLGTGLGPRPVNLFSPPCAPEGDAHERFYTRTPAPVWHGVATAHGHNDMLDDEGCGLLCLACPQGPDRANMRRYVAGQLVALFRGALQGDAEALRLLEDPATAPLPATAERR